MFFVLFKFNSKQRAKWVIFLLLVISLITDIWCYNLARNNIKTTWIINIFSVIEFAFLSYFFTLIISPKKQQIFIWLCYAGFLLYWLVQNIFVESIEIFDYQSQAIEFLLLLICCLLYLFQRVKNVRGEILYNTYQFWIVAALLMYCAGTFFGFLSSVSPEERDFDTIVYEYLSRGGNILKHILITIAFCINPANQKNEHPNKNSIYYIKDNLGKD